MFQKSFLKMLTGAFEERALRDFETEILFVTRRIYGHQWVYIFPLQVFSLTVSLLFILNSIQE